MDSQFKGSSESQSDSHSNTSSKMESLPESPPASPSFSSLSNYTPSESSTPRTRFSSRFWVHESNEQYVEDISLEIFYKPRTLTLLSIIIAGKKMETEVGNDLLIL